MDDIGFCPKCGKTLYDGATFCSACGTFVNDPEPGGRATAIDDSKNDGRIKLAVAILIIGAAIAIISAVTVYMMADWLAEWTFEAIEEVYPGLYTFDSLVSLFKWSAIMAMFGGAVAILTSILAMKRRVWMVTLILCLAASFMGFIFCLISVYLIYKAKSAFKD